MLARFALTKKLSAPFLFLMLLTALSSAPSHALYTMCWNFDEYDSNGVRYTPRCTEWDLPPMNDEQYCKYRGYDGINFWGWCNYYLDPSKHQLGLRNDGGRYPNQWIMQYIAAVPLLSNPPQACAGNPIDISNGVKHQQEIDITPNDPGQISFSRHYKNPTSLTDIAWLHNFDNRLRVFKHTETPALFIGERRYYKDTACVGAWSTFSDKSTDKRYKGSKANLINNQCIVSKMEQLSLPYPSSVLGAWSHWRFIRIKRQKPFSFRNLMAHCNINR